MLYFSVFSTHSSFSCTQLVSEFLKKFAKNHALQRTSSITPAPKKNVPPMYPTQRTSPQYLHPPHNPPHLPLPAPLPHVFPLTYCPRTLPHLPLPTHNLAPHTIRHHPSRTPHMYPTLNPHVPPPYSPKHTYLPPPPPPPPHTGTPPRTPNRMYPLNAPPAPHYVHSPHPTPPYIPTSTPQIASCTKPPPPPTHFLSSPTYATHPHKKSKSKIM